MEKVILPICVAALLLSACATPTQYAWQKSGIGKEDVRTAEAECRYQVKINKVAPTEQASVVNDCMMGKGFRWRVIN